MTWIEQKTLEELHPIPENIGAIVALANVIYVLVVFVHGAGRALRSVGLCLDEVQHDIDRIHSASPSTRREHDEIRDARLRVAKIMSLPLLVIIMHFLVAMFLALFSALLMNTPYVG